MERHLAGLRAEMSAPERNKFTAPLLLLHGLWSGSWMWHEASAAFSQRGWECWALDLRGRPGSHTVEAVGKIDLQDYVEDVTTAARALWAPPVICGHDLGALLALLAVQHISVRALLLIAPLLPRAWIENGRPPLPLVQLSALPALLWGRPLSPPRRSIAADFLFNMLSPAVQTDLIPRLISDSGTVARSLTSNQAPSPLTTVSCPVLIVSGSEDRMSPPAANRWLATQLPAAYREYPGHGHWLVADTQRTKLITDLHRWLIQTLGEELLVPEESEE
jgi:pimeloyl-ACP methyl ester carboxylesterase